VTQTPEASESRIVHNKGAYCVPAERSNTQPMALAGSWVPDSNHSCWNGRIAYAFTLANLICDQEAMRITSAM
jgi:hypothetical protein